MLRRKELPACFCQLGLSRPYRGCSLAGVHGWSGRAGVKALEALQAWSQSVGPPGELNGSVKRSS